MSEENKTISMMYRVYEFLKENPYSTMDSINKCTHFQYILSKTRNIIAFYTRIGVVKYKKSGASSTKKYYIVGFEGDTR